METLSSYEQQAMDFLNATETTFTSEFLKFAKHFSDDKEKRNIFKITLSNKNHTYSFNFGSSLQDSLENASNVIYDDKIDFYCGFKFPGLKNQFLSYSDKIKISTIKKAYLYDAELRKVIDKNKARKIYNEFIKANTTKYSTVHVFPYEWFLNEIEQKLIQKATELKERNFGEGVQSEKIKHPNAYDVLTCLQKYEVGTFENFCADFGYDEDSRKAYKVYESVVVEWENIEKLFTIEQLEQLKEIQ